MLFPDCSSKNRKSKAKLDSRNPIIHFLLFVFRKYSCNQSKNRRQQKMLYFSIASTVNVLEQYVLSGPIVVVHLFSKRAPQACTARRSPARYMLAEQMYHNNGAAKNILP